MNKKELRKKAEDYGNGSTTGDFLGVNDGSETLQDGINTNQQSNGDGQGAVPAGGHANHPVTPLGEQGHEKPNQSGEEPFSESLVDDNHGNNGTGLGSVAKGLLRFFKQADENNFFTQNSTSGGVADSPQTMDDGYPYEELSDPGALQQTFNNDAHPTNEADVSLLRDPKLINKNRDDTPQINKGGTFAHLKFYPFMSVSLGSLFKKALNPDTDYKNHSNVADIMNPVENSIKHDKATHDFGTGDQMNDSIPMAAAPLSGDGQTEEEKNYSGRDNATAGLLHFFVKKADYAGVMPSVNPNSGKDEDYPDTNGQGYSDIGQAMTDGKTNSDNMDDKVDNDPTQYRKKLNYNRNRPSSEDSTSGYFSTLNSGSGFGGEGDGQNFSGVNH